LRSFRQGRIALLRPVKLKGSDFAQKTFKMTTKPTQSYVIHSKGIFRGLPDISTDLSGLKAIVVGASGTSGQPMIDVLSSNPQRWDKIYALSRKAPKMEKGSNVEHVSIDLLSEPEKIAAVLRKHQVQA
jgi:5,10-methylene-tetrahydrofolate dehydrogenase/methenyl tetrahydrofolate cyclohydrolase